MAKQIYKKKHTNAFPSGDVLMVNRQHLKPAYNLYECRWYKCHGLISFAKAATYSNRHLFQLRWQLCSLESLQGPADRALGIRAEFHVSRRHAFPYSSAPLVQAISQRISLATTRKTETAARFLAQLFIHLFRTLCENFGPRSLKVRSPGHVK